MIYAIFFSKDYLSYIKLNKIIPDDCEVLNPSGSIETQNSHGIPVLKNEDELKNWYHSLKIENVKYHD
jgi:hypothetical protein